MEVAWAEVSDFLELDIYSFGEVSHSTVDTADCGSCCPWCFVNLGCVVELGHPSLFLEASFEVGGFCFREFFGIELYKELKLECSSIQSVLGFNVGEPFVSLWVQ